MTTTLTIPVAQENLGGKIISFDGDDRLYVVFRQTGATITREPLFSELLLDRAERWMRETAATWRRKMEFLWLDIAVLVERIHS